MAGAVAIVLWFEPDRTPLVTVVGLLILFVFVLIPVLHLPLIRNKRTGFPRMMSHALGTVVVAVGLVSYGFHVWPDTRLGVLTDK